ncbi:FliO/MopB family protein [Govanella unica]|uniref:Flagellar biosynthetic protein FliO n=1 Tax=Govanella unica TaxID=2975056 RepID=A0A9X3TWX4_9PROT|nr:flagellar biosynthetic protein FliO [Govania unica]MDA5193229.1 flagellar biosynthetic protein FliO [Govania unica]
MDSVNYFRFVAALVFVLALLGACAWAARRFGFLPQVTPRKGAKKRLEILEIMALDARRRFVLIRRDDVEHLVLVGDGETVIERAITPASKPAPETKP